MKLTSKDVIRLKDIEELEPTLDNVIEAHNHLAKHSIKMTDVLNKQTKIIKRNQKLLGLSLIVTGYLSLCLYRDEKRISRLEKIEEDKRRQPYPTYSTTYSNKKGE